MRLYLATSLTAMTLSMSSFGQNWAAQSKAMFQQKQFDSAIHLLNSTAQSGPAQSRAEAFYELGFILLAGKKDVEAARAAFEQAAKLSNYNTASRAALSTLYQLQEKWTELVNILEPIKYEKDFTKGAPPDGSSSAFPSRSLIIKTYVYGLGNQNEYDKADIYLNKLYLSESDLINVFELKGDMYMSKSQWSRASQAYEQYVNDYEMNVARYSKGEQNRFKPSAKLFERWQEAVENSGQKTKLLVVQAKAKQYTQ